jgi:amino acid transporter
MDGEANEGIKDYLSY